MKVAHGPPLHRSMSWREPARQAVRWRVRRNHTKKVPEDRLVPQSFSAPSSDTKAGLGEQAERRPDMKDARIR